MTNEELLRAYKDGLGDGEEILEALYENNHGLILVIAKEVAAAFHCIRHSEAGAYTAYTTQILCELEAEGTVELFRIIRTGGYDESVAQFSTYIYPFLKGAMWRWMEVNLGVLSLTARDMELLRTVQREYYTEGMNEAELMKAHDLTELELQRYLTYNTHFLSVYDLIPADAYEANEPFDPYEYLNPMASGNTVPWIVYRKICYELLKALFFSLPEKDRNILGHSMGIFGFEKKSTKSIALKEMLTMDGVIKARKAAEQKLMDLYPGSELQRWRKIYHLVMHTSW